VGLPWRAVWDALAGLPRRGCAPPRNDKKGAGMCGVVRHGLGMRSPPRLSLRARQGVAIQSDASCGMPRRCDGCPRAAGLPRRCAPRNDNGGEWWARCVRLRFSGVYPALSLRARQGAAIRSPHFLSLRGRYRRELTWQSSLMRHVGCRSDAGVALAAAGLPRRCASRNDNGGEWWARWGGSSRFSDATPKAVIASPFRA
jgi:hypothetical protein